jgi:hypothetical protein
MASEKKLLYTPHGSRQRSISHAFCSREQARIGPVRMLLPRAVGCAARTFQQMSCDQVKNPSTFCIPTPSRHLHIHFLFSRMLKQEHAGRAGAAFFTPWTPGPGFEACAVAPACPRPTLQLRPARGCAAARPARGQRCCARL